MRMATAAPDGSSNSSAAISSLAIAWRSLPFERRRFCFLVRDTDSFYLKSELFGQRRLSARAICPLRVRLRIDARLPIADLRRPSALDVGEDGGNLVVA